MAQLPADVSPGDGSHDDHHDALHGLYNHMDTVGGGDVTAAWTAAEKSKLAAIEAGADVTDTTNVTAAGALMDSEVDADIKTLSLPASTTISTFGASLVDDADAATARTTLGITQGGTVRNTHAHSGAGALSISRQGPDQATVVTISANATSWTDNLTTDLDHIYMILVGDGGSATYTVDLSAALDASFTIYPDTEIELSVLKRGANLWAVSRVLAAGTVPAINYRGGYVEPASSTGTTNIAASSLNVTPTTGDTLVFMSTVQGVTEYGGNAAWTTPTGATVLATNNASDFIPQTRIWTKSYASESDWGSWGADASNSRNAVFVFESSSNVSVAFADDTTTLPSVTSPAAGSAVAYATSHNYAGSGGNATWDPPAGWTQRFDETPDTRAITFGTQDTAHVSGNAGGVQGTETGDSNETLITIVVEP